MKILSFLLMICVACTAFFGCAAPAENTESDDKPADKAVTIADTGEAMPLIAPEYGEQDADISAAAGGANDFAFRLSAALLKEGTGKSFVCSPFSAYLPLAALVSATDDANKPALLKALGADGLTEDALNTAASRMLYELTRQRDAEYAEEYDGYSYHNPISIANAVFVDNDFTLNTEFAKTFRDYYLGASMEVDFADPSALEIINEWASDNTHGLINEILKELDPDTVTAIANAIYFEDRWVWEFDEAETIEDVFHSPSGDTTANFMLREGESQSYYEDESIQAMPLRFKTGGAMYILLPKDGDAEKLLKSMTAERFDEIASGMDSRTGKLLLPRFTIEGDTISLNDALIALGVPLFDPDTLPVNGLVNETDAYLTKVMQKALIKVDEKGTTAAAVTVELAAGTAMPMPTEPFEMKCDSPFMFVLCGYTYDGGNQVLFTGVVNQPE